MDNEINQIDLSTRRNILDSFLITKITWYGNLEQTDFLDRLFDLSKMPSYDSRFTDAYQDIEKHTILNDDWPDEWVFTDRRFNLLHIEDKLFLDFLCLTIHPAVRDDEDKKTTLLEIYNNNLSKLGLEIVENVKIGDKWTYNSKKITRKSTINKTIETGEKKLALVVGCSQYQFSGELKNPVNDAKKMGKTLIELGFDVIEAINPSQKELLKIIDLFGDKLHNFNVGLFFYAGHGVQVKGINYLIPIDAEIKTEIMVEYDCVNANRILSYMENSKGNVNIVILDACRDNPFERNWGRGIGQRGLTVMNSPMGSLIAYSTAPGKTASDGNGENGLYTEVLLEYITAKGVSILPMFQNVRRDVQSKSNNEQTPWESTSLTTDFFFNP